MRWWNRPLVPFIASRAGAWLYVNVMPHIDRPLVRLSRGRLATAPGEPVLLLTTTGAKTGRSRTVPLLYVEHGDDVVLIASKGGNLRHPAWYHNLKARPEASVQIKGRTTMRIASEAEGDERAALWRRAVDLYPGYENYQSRTRGRKIPVMVLSPAPADEPGTD